MNVFAGMKSFKMIKLQYVEFDININVGFINVTLQNSTASQYF